MNTNRHIRNTCAGLILASGLAAPAGAVDKSWNSDAGLWSEAASWFPVGIPAATDGVFIGNISGVENDTVTLNQSSTIAALTISDGMTLRTDHRTLRVNGNTLISGSNTVVGGGGAPIAYPSRLRLESVDGMTFETDDISVVSGARLTLEQAVAVIHDTLTIGASSRAEERAYVNFDGSGTTLVNNGLIDAGAGDGLRLRQFGGGVFNLDGTTENGVVNLYAAAGAALYLEGTGLSDAFDGTIEMSMNADLHVELSSGWTATQNSSITVTGYGADFIPSQIRGGPFSFAGELSVVGAQAVVHVTPSELEIEPAARVVLYPDTRAEFGAGAGTQTTIDGGAFSVLHDSDLVFLGATIVHAGQFTTSTTNIADGAVYFSGPTTWAGSVTINGIARQAAGAAVTGSTVITADVFDMDGLAASPWTIQAGLTINAGAIETGVNNVASVIGVSGGAGARLTVNLDDPSDYWIASGELNLSGLGGGGAHLPALRIAGSPLWVTGGLNVASGRVDVSAPIRLMDDAVVTFGVASAELRFNAESLIFPSVAFVGAGKLVSGVNGDMTLETGLTTGGVGLLNSGVLRIGAVSGIASVDRFENTGTWRVQIGGHAAGTEYDQLIVAGGAATIAGSLAVELIDQDGVGGAFRPVVGDTFTILTAVGGVSGAFPAEIETESDGSIYEWTVTSNPNDVTVTLERVTPIDCIADFNHDGVVNSQDFFDFLSQFFIENVRADVNHDGIVNSQDFFDFLVVFFNGCG